MQLAAQPETAQTYLQEGSSVPRKRIERFDGKYAFLSNFAPIPVRFLGNRYWTAEHAYQAQKTDRAYEREPIIHSKNPVRAKRLGRQVTMRRDWDEVKVDVMRLIVVAKFTQSHKAYIQLLDTRNAELIEGNYWHDTFWGVCNGKGQNILGVLLMETREQLRRIS